MGQIHVLDSKTIDKIAAGEVVERPVSVVKELVENAIDSGATMITVEAKEGGIKLLRVTDNGCGIVQEDVPSAFLRHATSKIRDDKDLFDLSTLGFRGEALASIAAVAMVELVTKTPEALVGTRYVVHGGNYVESGEVGAPDGTTILVSNLFYNVPARRKFLKKEHTEGVYISDMMEHLALSRPDISFKLILNGQIRFFTSGNGKVEDVIYRIFGKSMSDSVRPIDVRDEMLGIRMYGLLGEPIVNRSNRGYELFYVNGRYIESKLLSKAVEDGYRGYVMQHKFPFCVLFFEFDAGKVDVNVHPSKKEVRFSQEKEVTEFVFHSVEDHLHEQEMMPSVILEEKKEETGEKIARADLPESFEKSRLAEMVRQTQAVYRTNEGAAEKVSVSTGSLETLFDDEPAETEDGMDKSVSCRNVPQDPVQAKEGQPVTRGEHELEEEPKPSDEPAPPEEPVPQEEPMAPDKRIVLPEGGGQMNLFEDKILSQSSRARYRLIGQLFRTYWLIELDDKLLIMDQHAAHEKVKYERLIKEYSLRKEVPSQLLAPPVVVSLATKEEAVLKQYAQELERMGFVTEPLGGKEYALRSIPLDLFGNMPKDLFEELLTQLGEERSASDSDSICHRIATMACKSAVKGNTRITTTEAEELLDELMTLQNPYHCPHGRPTMIVLSEEELEKKFSRIVTG